MVWNGDLGANNLEGFQNLLGYSLKHPEPNNTIKVEGIRKQEVGRPK